MKKAAKKTTSGTEAMIWPFSRKPKQAPEPVHAVYAAIVAQSRQPHFYADWQVPDTLTGRFDMVSLHLGLVLRRLRNKDAETKIFAQALFDLFFLDMDRTLREMGVGDLSVPKKISKMGELFYGLLSALTEALQADAPLEMLEGALVRNIYGEDNEHVPALALYVRDYAARLDRQPISEIVAGKLGEAEAA